MSLLRVSLAGIARGAGCVPAPAQHSHCEYPAASAELSAFSSAGLVALQQERLEDCSTRGAPAALRAEQLGQACEARSSLTRPSQQRCARASTGLASNSTPRPTAIAWAGLPRNMLYIPYRVNGTTFNCHPHLAASQLELGRYEQTSLPNRLCQIDYFSTTSPLFARNAGSAENLPCML